ncbi:hypothetical protein [Agrobacterium sp. lyk4-40-TYG-31]|uniref:hypothetical protein n=1 Tax=Agrobacterium sp. lyk4-40-TYG-31 TaxID=3040276 RepID=UPI002550BABC|nr:hypothetical protein [Agrobacterium sp. lyk4-40-TYG-31]
MLKGSAEPECPLGGAAEIRGQASSTAQIDWRPIYDSQGFDPEPRNFIRRPALSKSNPDKETRMWTPIAVLPSVDVRTNKLGGAHIALIGSGDPRYQAFVGANDDLMTFLARFTGSHGEALRPSVIAVSSEYAGKPVAHAIASFKDIVVAAVTLDTRVLTILSDNNRGPFYSSSFDIYPWMVTNRSDRLVAMTPAISALHQLKGFRGIASPSVPIHQVEDSHVHSGLFEGLYRLWTQQYLEEKGEAWEVRSILRSLNMAATAMEVPNTSVTETIYDWGRVIAHWVSAFEILVHPGADGRADERMVLDMLARVEWRRGMLIEKSHSVKIGRGPASDRTLAEWLYHRLFKLRNDYLHGNPVDARGFDMENATSILHVPAALYRMALTTRVPAEDPITNEDVREKRRTLAEYSRFYQSTLFQHHCEEILLRAVDPDALKDDE